MKRSPIARKSRLRPRSTKKAAQDRRCATVRVEAHERAGGVCQRCHAERSHDIHHVNQRSTGGTDDLDNLVALCRPCHMHIHDHIAEAVRDGWIYSQKDMS